MTLVDLTATDLYRSVLADILACGASVAPRGFETKEVIGYQFTLVNPILNLINSPSRKLNYAFGVAEFLWILAGRDDLQFLQLFNKRMAEFSDDGHKLAGAYGPKVRRQLPYVIRTLQQDPSSRQAVISLWAPNPPKSKDIPCTTTMQFLLRDGLLHMVVTMRSNDAWLGLPYDLYSFTMLQQVVALTLGAQVGHYTHHVGSMHLYAQHWGPAEGVVQETTEQLVCEPLTGLTLPVAGGLSMILGRIASGERNFLEHYVHFPPEWYHLLAVLEYHFHKRKTFLPVPWCDLVG